ncbi:hypothetical protein GCM10017566_26140 [Amycolatopsis bartoniae]|uniref:Uncharacterized protein n=1 Tax=Amycolatopsis bartoniae TaxID=941986 RepID=A0A8H9IV33_9PSEU|nr:hypothetical protein GCM10017566_26140 [Amycolatopsis bartoniae]
MQLRNGPPRPLESYRPDANRNASTATACTGASTTVTPTAAAAARDQRTIFPGTFGRRFPAKWVARRVGPLRRVYNGLYFTA